MVKQFDVYWVNLDPTVGAEIAKTRPCVVVSPDELNRYLRTAIVIPLTSVVRGYPFRVQCVVAGKRGEIAIDQIKTVDKSRINTAKRLARLSQQEVEDLQDVLSQMFCER